MSDFVEPDGAIERPFPWEGPLRRMARRHEVLVVEVVDPRELSLVDVGPVVMVDPETGHRCEVWTSLASVRDSYARGAAHHREQVAQAVRAAGAAHLVLRTDQDWLRDLAGHVVATRRRGVRRPTPQRTQTQPSEEHLMNLAAPWWLLLLVPVAALATAYIIQQRRRSAYAVRFATLPMLERLVPRSPGWRRTRRAALFLTSPSPCSGSPPHAPRWRSACPRSRPP